MARCKYLLLIVLLFSVFINPVSALCNYEEQAALNKEVANVKANYEVVNIDVGKDYCYPLDGYETEDYTCYADVIQIVILNISKNFVVRIENDDYDFKYDYKYSDTDNGTLTFYLTDKDGQKIQYNPTVTEYEIEVLASSETGCEGSTLRTFNLTIPRYNSYSDLKYCDALSDYYLCQKYVTYDRVPYEDFSKRITEEINKRNEQKEEELKWYEKIWEFVVDHKTVFIVGGIIAVVAGGGTAVYIIIRRRRDIV